MEKESLERWFEQGLSLEEIGRRVSRHPSTVGYWAKRHGLVPPGREKHRARGGLARDDLEQLLAQGKSYRQIAADLRVSLSTVRHWMGRYGLASVAAERRRETAEAKRAGRGVLQRDCPTHGPTTFLLEGRGSYRCMDCRVERVSRRRRAVKASLVAEAGGRCIICGYSKYLGALQFHHLDPTTKRFGVSATGVTRSIDDVREEVAGCALLCSNCHAEVEGGVRALPGLECQQVQVPSSVAQALDPG